MVSHNRLVPRQRARAAGCWPLSRIDARSAPVHRSHSRPRRGALRQHLIAHHEWWNDEENANALDELRMMAICALRGDTRWTDWPEGGEKLKPPTLLRRLREAAELRELGPDVHFSHLDRYEDPPAEENTLSACSGARTRSPVWRSSSAAVQVATSTKSSAGATCSWRPSREKPTALTGYAGGSEGITDRWRRRTGTWMLVCRRVRQVLPALPEGEGRHYALEPGE